MLYEVKEATVTTPVFDLPNGAIVLELEHQLERKGEAGTTWAGFHLPEQWHLTYLKPIVSGENVKRINSQKEG